MIHRTHHRTRHALIALAWWLACSPPAVAQTAGVVPTPSQVFPAGERPPNSSKDEPTLPQAADSTIRREMSKPGTDMLVDVTAYQVDGGPPELTAALPRLTAPHVGQARSYDDLLDAVAAVTRFLHKDLGYYVGYAYLPEQQPQNGVIHISVLEGRLDDIQIDWGEDVPVERRMVEPLLSRLKPGDILRVREVERVIFLINDLRGLTARFELKSGRQVGTVSLVVTVRPEPRLSGKVEVDTSGSRYSGLARLGATAMVASPTRSGDGLSFSLLRSFTGGINFALASYLRPVGSDGWKLGASGSMARYALDDDLLPLQLRGQWSGLNLFALYPWVRSRDLNLFALLSYEAKRYEDRQKLVNLTSRKHGDEVRVSLSGDFRDNWLTGGISTYEASVSALDMTREGMNGGSADAPARTSKAQLGYSRLQNLVDNRLLLYLNYQGQLAMANLDSTEQFSLGGSNRVRAFASGEGTGDQGHVISLELRALPPQAWFGRTSREVVFNVFYDWGQIRYRHDASNEQAGFRNRSSLSGYGLGLVWDKPNAWSARLYLAWPGSGQARTEPERSGPRAYLTLVKPF